MFYDVAVVVAVDDVVDDVVVVSVVVVAVVEKSTMALSINIRSRTGALRSLL